MPNEITNNDIKALKKYLSRYYRAKEQKAILRDRLYSLRSELACPPVSALHSGEPKKHRNGPARKDRTTALTFNVAQIEALIQKQSEAESAAILEIMQTLELLPPCSIEKTVLELRHIDCKTWTEIANAVHLTRTPCNKYYRRGLEQLLTFESVRRAVRDYSSTGSGPEI